MARDLGCSFPLCDSTPLHTEAHHIVEHQAGGATSTDNGTLLCGHDHTNFHAMGWNNITINGVPWWIPPTWTDTEHKPIRKTLPHDRE